MDALAAIALIAWFVISAISKRKKREAAEAAKRAAADAAAQAAQSAPSAAPVTPRYEAPVQRNPAPVAPAQKAFDPFFGGLMEALGELDADKPKPEAKPQPAVQAPHVAPQRTREPMQPRMAAAPAAGSKPAMQTTLRHTLEASSITGHAHTESSITGVEPECEPAKDPHARVNKSAATAVQSAAPASAFTWNVSDAARGLILSEILGKPKALTR